MRICMCCSVVWRIVWYEAQHTFNWQSSWKESVKQHTTTNRNIGRLNNKTYSNESGKLNYTEKRNIDGNTHTDTNTIIFGILYICSSRSVGWKRKWATKKWVKNGVYQNSKKRWCICVGATIRLTKKEYWYISLSFLLFGYACVFDVEYFIAIKLSV